MYAGLGLGRFFLENNGNNTLNVTGGGRYWFSNHYGFSVQGFGKVGLSPINKSVLNHYQYNLGLVWRSNRNKVKLVDAVTKLEEIKKIDSIQEQELSVKIEDKETKSILDDPKLTIVEKKQDLITEKADDTTKDQNSTIAKETGKTNLPLVIQNKGCDYKIGDDLGKCVGIKMIYFALDKYFITNQATVDLEKILFVLNEYPTMKIDIRSHTDCRQTMKYNQVLSENRAKATMNWLVKKGIDKSRLTAKGYGQSQLINNCDCSPTKKSSCTEEEHQANRRSEFIITSF
jgi:peptidoglycan-associated lipoprotein